MENLKERPQCGLDGCENPALVLLAGVFVCGDCCVEYEKQKNKKLMNQLNILKKERKWEQ